MWHRQTVVTKISVRFRVQVEKPFRELRFNGAAYIAGTTVSPTGAYDVKDRHRHHGEGEGYLERGLDGRRDPLPISCLIS